MKVSNINLKVYENISKLNNRSYRTDAIQDRNKSANKVSGAKFADYLNRREIDFLNTNFGTIQAENGSMAGEQVEKHLGRRVDIVA